MFIYSTVGALGNFSSLANHMKNNAGEVTDKECQIR